MRFSSSLSQCTSCHLFPSRLLSSLALPSIALSCSHSDSRPSLSYVSPLLTPVATPIRSITRSTWFHPFLTSREQICVVCSTRPRLASLSSYSRSDPLSVLRCYGGSSLSLSLSLSRS